MVSWTEAARELTARPDFALAVPAQQFHVGIHH
jgi:hypothetical protein